MKKIFTGALAVLLIASSGYARSYKRGVGENQFMVAEQLEVLEPGVSWWYNWGNTPNSGYDDAVVNYEGMEYVPMCWNANYSADKIREYVKAHPNTKYLLGFNEPNFKAQSNMTPQQAAEKWPEVKALADELGLKLVAPALNYSPDAPYTTPAKWMDEFIALVGNDAFDFTALHNYGGLGVLKNLCKEFHDKYGKPIWVTEFCYWPGGAGNVYVAPETQLASCIESVEFLERTDYIYRYAWFKPVGSSDSANKPNYGLEDVHTNRLPDGTREYTAELTNLGYVYTYMSDFNPDVWHKTAVRVPASEYIAQNGISMVRSTMAGSPNPIMVTNLNAGAWIEYQFDVPEDGSYGMQLTVGGYGEPSRFNPTLRIYLNDGGSLEPLTDAKSFELPNSDDTFRTQNFVVRLKAGHRTLRIADESPYQPSGITMPMVVLGDASGVEGIEEEQNHSAAPVYTIDGRIVKGTPSEPGIYICNGRKFVVK